MSNHSIAERMHQGLLRFRRGELSVDELVSTLHGYATAIEGHSRKQRELIDAIFDLEKAQFEFEDSERQASMDTLTCRIAVLIDEVAR